MRFCLERPHGYRNSHCVSPSVANRIRERPSARQSGCSAWAVQVSRAFLKNRFVELLQPLKLFHPLRRRQTAERRHLHGSIKPTADLAARRVEVSVSALDLNVIAEPVKFVGDVASGLHLAGDPLSRRWHGHGFGDGHRRAAMPRSFHVPRIAARERSCLRRVDCVYVVPIADSTS